MKPNLFVCLIIAMALGGCLSHYQYRSYGELPYPNGENRSAVLFWSRDEGRLWFGNGSDGSDLQVNLRVCEKIPKTFHTTNQGHLELPSKAQDKQVAQVSEQGNFVELGDTVTLPANKTCGFILVEDNRAGIDDLSIGVSPEVNIICTSIVRPDRYPVAGEYPFQAITRVKVDKGRVGPPSCVEEL